MGVLRNGRRALRATAPAQLEAPTATEDAPSPSDVAYCDLDALLLRAATRCSALVVEREPVLVSERKSSAFLCPKERELVLVSEGKNPLLS